MELQVFADQEALAGTAASIIRQAISRAEPERFQLALSGGSTPRRLLEILADQISDWSRIDIFQVDERIAPAGSPDRNLTMLEETLPPEARTVINAMPVDEADLEAAAAAYAAGLPDRFDLVVLGLGDDGHTASLFAGDPALTVVDRGVVITEPQRKWQRMTLTYPVLDRAEALVWLVSGTIKRTALSRLLAGDGSIPAGRVHPDRAVVLADQAAVGV